MQLLHGVGCQGGGGLPSVHLQGTRTLGLLGPESRLYRGGQLQLALGLLGLESRPCEGGRSGLSLDWLGLLGLLAFGLTVGCWACTYSIRSCWVGLFN